MGSLYPDRDKEIVAMYKEGKYTLKEVGKKYHISNERVRQILNREAAADSPKKESDLWAALSFLSTHRVYNALIHNSGISTLDQLKRCPASQLAKIRGIGEESIKALIEKGLVTDDSSPVVILDSLGSTVVCREQEMQPKRDDV